MSEVQRYYVGKYGLVEGEALGRLSVVLAADFDRVTAERDAVRETLENSYTAEDHERLVAKGQELNVKYIEKLEQRLTAADERAGALETEVARLNRVKLSLKDLAESRADNCSVYRKHLNEALTMAEKVRDASLGMQRKYLADLIDYLHQNGVALKPAEGGGDTKSIGGKCWSCKEPVTLIEWVEADGNCPHCNAEIDEAEGIKP